MQHLLNLLAAIALLVWGTHMVRTGILRVFGANLRQILARSISNRFTAALSGIGVTAVVQSSTATALIVSSFVGQGLVALPLALAVMLGADIGTSLMAVAFSFDLSWLSPLCVFAGVVLFLARPDTNAGRFGRILIGLGLMLMALRLVSASTQILTQAPAVKALLESLGSDLLLEITVGAFLTVVSYSSLAVVLLTATLVGTSVIPSDVALGLVLGANLGSGLLAVITTARSASSRSSFLMTSSMPRSMVSTTSAWCSASRTAQEMASEGVARADGSRWWCRPPALPLSSAGSSFWTHRAITCVQPMNSSPASRLKAR